MQAEMTTGVHRSIRLVVVAWLALISVVAVASALGPDGERGSRHPGRFVWFDLATEDPAGARTFYGAVFGWRFRQAEGAPGPYTLIEHASGKVGGMFLYARPQGAPVGARWLSLMSVGDPARVAAYVRRNGGKVIVAPETVQGRGTHAVFEDPEGAVFGVLAAADGDPPDTPVADGDVFWLDLFARNPEKAADFYAGIAGYEIGASRNEGEPMQLVLSSSGIARAGIAPMPTGLSRPGWLPYVLVSDVAGVTERALKAGGKILIAPSPNLLGGNLAVISDPSGGVLGVVNWQTGAAGAAGAKP
jgi:predicted enzyme related to lactoylglutathione lyase